MPADRSDVDLVGIFQKALRSPAGASKQGYKCYICESYTGEVEVWEHAKQAHPGHRDITNLENEAEAKRRFLEQAYVPDVILLFSCLKSYPHLTIILQVRDDQLMQVMLGNDGLSAIELFPTNHRRGLSREHLQNEITEESGVQNKTRRGPLKAIAHMKLGVPSCQKLHLGKINSVRKVTALSKTKGEKLEAQLVRQSRTRAPIKRTPGLTGVGTLGSYLSKIIIPQFNMLAVSNTLLMRIFRVSI